jgi:tetratricopeptide (TPR) repeat protein
MTEKPSAGGPLPARLRTELPPDGATLDRDIATLGAALEREPDRPELAVRLAALLRAKGLTLEARGLLELALALAPGSAAAQLELGNLARAEGEPVRALEAYARAAALAPEAIEPLGNCALAYKDLGRLDAAIETLEAVRARAPDNPELAYNLGNCRYAAGDLDGAAAEYEAALALAPAHRGARINLGLVRRDQGNAAAAIAAFDRVIAERPDHPLAHWNRALSLLLSGDFGRGFPAYEWRWQATGMNPRGIAAPPWDGSPLAGRTILLHAEQGLGDTIQFVRYAPMVAARGGRVLLEVQAPLLQLCRTLGGVEAVFARGDALPGFDCHAPLMSLPALFGTTLETIPNPVPYLAPLSAFKTALKAALNGPAGVRRIGLVWGGNPARQGDAVRSCRARDLLPLTTLANFRLFSLQKGSPHAEQAAELTGVIELGPLLEDLADTTYALSRLDLLISVDTASAHLAGALGRPVWTLLAYAADWRYLLHRSDSLWYPTMRLFRQERPGAWDGPIGRVHAAIASGLL